MTVKNWRPELDIPSVGSRKLREKIEEWFFPFIEDICDLEDLRHSAFKRWTRLLFRSHSFAVVNELAPAFLLANGKNLELSIKRGKTQFFPLK